MIQKLVASIMAEADKLRKANKLEFRPSVYQAMKNVGIRDNDPHRGEYLSRVFSEYGKRRKRDTQPAPRVVSRDTHEEERRALKEWEREQMMEGARAAERLHPPDAIGKEEEDAA